MKIGIGVTTHNRNEIVKNTIEEIKKYTPGAKIVMVDDASTEPVEGATFRFSQNVGIARAKNKCLELLRDCDHIFLFDDDTHPQKENWWKPYVESPEPHLMYLFNDFINQPRLNDAKELYRDSELFAMSHPRGCMLYVERPVLDVVGGMDTRYGRWGNEHVDWSNRIYNAGLTSFRYADVVGSNALIYSGDEHETVITTVKHQERKVYLAQSKPLLERSRDSADYMEYFDKVNDTSNQCNIILSCYFTGSVDPQRNKKWENNYTQDTAALIESTEKLDIETIILRDMDNPITLNPYFQRWLSYYQYLREHPGIDNVFCVDATDVTILKNPFLYIEQDKIYCGDEPSMLASSWMLNYNPEEPIRSYLRRNGRLPLLNAGVLGGNREDILKVAHDICRLYFDNGAVFHNDMGAFNYVLRNKYADRVEYGRKITTVFKSFDTHNEESWICHK